MDRRIAYSPAFTAVLEIDPDLFSLEEERELDRYARHDLCCDDEDDES